MVCLPIRWHSPLLTPTLSAPKDWSRVGSHNGPHASFPHFRYSAGGQKRHCAPAGGGRCKNKSGCESLRTKQIAGAGLDVFEYEPKVGKDLRSLKNVLLTPHLGSAVGEVRERMAHLVADNILAFLAGKNSPNCVNPQVLPVK